MLRVVLDTNVIVSGLNFPTSNPAKILLLAASGEVANFTSRHIVNETRRILVDKFFWTHQEVEAAEVWLKTCSKSVDPKNRIAVIVDDPDNRIPNVP
jgi:putative PIN family toxin of toxin-antitoxin system